MGSASGLPRALLRWPCTAELCGGSSVLQVTTCLFRIRRYPRHISAYFLALPIQTLADCERKLFIERLVCAHGVRNKPRQKPELRVACDWRRTIRDNVLCGQQQLVCDLAEAETRLSLGVSSPSAITWMRCRRFRRSLDASVGNFSPSEQIGAHTGHVGTQG
jgi:hypothetical protein